MSDLKIRNLKFESVEVGRMVKSSKCIFTWEFILDENRRKVELQHSRLTGKRRINLDGKNLTKCQKYTYNFTYSFVVDKHYLTIYQISPEQYDLRIDNISFFSLMNKEKMDKFKESRKEAPSDDANDYQKKGDKKRGPTFDEFKNPTVSKMNELDNDFFGGGNKYSTKADDKFFQSEFEDFDFKPGQGKHQQEGFDFDKKDKSNAFSFDQFGNGSNFTNIKTSKSSNLVQNDFDSNNNTAVKQNTNNFAQQPINSNLVNLLDFEPTEKKKDLMEMNINLILPHNSSGQGTIPQTNVKIFLTFFRIWDLISKRILTPNHQQVFPNIPNH